MDSIRQGTDPAEWFCGRALGGCRATFALDDPRILGQLRPHVADEYRRRAQPAPPPSEPKLTADEVRQLERRAELVDEFLAWFGEHGRGETEGQAFVRWREARGIASHVVAATLVSVLADRMKTRERAG